MQTKRCQYGRKLNSGYFRSGWGDKHPHAYQPFPHTIDQLNDFLVSPTLGQADPCLESVVTSD